MGGGHTHTLTRVNKTPWESRSSGVRYVRACMCVSVCHCGRIKQWLWHLPTTANTKNKAAVISVWHETSTDEYIWIICSPFRHSCTNNELNHCSLSLKMRIMYPQRCCTLDRGQKSTQKLSRVCCVSQTAPTLSQNQSPHCVFGCVSLSCPCPRAERGWGGRGQGDGEGGGVSSSTSKGLWRYSGARHSTSSFLPLLLSLPEPFPAYQPFSAQSDQREREGERSEPRLRPSLQESFGS